jgi:formate-dependent nitrite reductase membrane component NrfD
MSPVLQPLAQAPWPPLIGVYFILAGLAAGTSLVAEWVRPQQERGAAAFAWKMEWLALLALMLCGAILIRDLGRPERFVLMLTSMANLGSAMSVGAKLIALKGLLLAYVLYLLYRRRRALAAGDMTLAPGVTQTVYAVAPGLLAVASLCLAVYPAMLLARTWSAPLAASSGAGLLFASTALLMGLAVGALLVRDAEHAARLRAMMLFLAVAQLGLLLFAGLSLYGGAPALAHALHTLTIGTAASLFWGVAVGVGLGVPCVLLLLGSSHRALILVSAGCLLVGAATLRWLVFSVAFGRYHQPLSQRLWYTFSVQPSRPVLPQSARCYPRYHRGERLGSRRL